MDDEFTLEDVLKALRMGMADTAIQGVRIGRPHLRMIVEHIAELQQYKNWYEEAMVMSNKHGYACMSAAEVIDDLAYGLKQAEGRTDGK